MHLIPGLFLLLGSQSIDVFGYREVKSSSLGETLYKCAICINMADTYATGKRNPNTFRIPSGARRHEFLLRSSDKQTVSVFFYDGSEPTNKFQLTLGSGNSHDATLTKDCCFNITILQPTDYNSNAEVYFSDTNSRETLRGNPITYLGFEISKPLLVCSCGSREECNGTTEHKRNNENPSHPPTPTSAPDDSRKGKEHTVTGTADATRENNSNDSVTGGCNKTVTTVLGILLALSVIINKILLIRIGICNVCSNQNDRGLKLEPNTNTSRQGLELRNSGHVSENSLYGAVINRS